MADENSKRSRVDPVFGWLAEHGEDDWPRRLLQLAHGLEVDIVPGRTSTPVRLEVGVRASQERLEWLLQNAEELGHEGEFLDEIRRRSSSSDSRLRILEGTTYADCLVECEHAIIWIEGKRHDWLSPGTKWDPKRDQLARNLEAAWLSSLEREKGEFCVLLCHETDLRPEELALVEGYRSGTLVDGVPHLPADIRAEFARRVGTVTWAEIVASWPSMRSDPRLLDFPD